MRNETDNLGHGENGEEAMEKTAARNYTGHGWEGSRYTGYRDIKDIAKDIRKELKSKFPASKFSVTIERFSGGCGLNVYLVAGPFDPFAEKPSEKRATARYSNEELEADLARLREKGNSQLNEYALLNHSTYEEYRDYDAGLLSERGYEIVKYAVQLVTSYRRDDSDGMIDYFDTNFYAHFEVGKWDKPFVNTKGGKA